MTRNKIEAMRGRWVTVLLANGRLYTGFLRRLKREGSLQLYSCGSSGPFTMSYVTRIDEVLT